MFLASTHYALSSIIFHITKKINLIKKNLCPWALTGKCVEFEFNKKFMSKLKSMLFNCIYTEF